MSSLHSVRAACASAVIAALALVGCAPQADNTQRSPRPTVETSPSASPAPSAAPAPDASTPPDGGEASEGPTEAASQPTQQGTIDEPIALSDGMVIAIDRVSATSVEAETPGEVSGSAVVVVVTASNDSDTVLSVDNAFVTLVANNDGTLGIPTTAGEPQPLAGELAPGESASGRYVFMLDAASGRDVTVTVNHGPGAPIAEFMGAVG